MATPSSTAELIASMARDKAREKVAGAKPSRRGDLKAIARDLRAALKSDNDDDLAAVLEAYRDVSGSDD